MPLVIPSRSYLDEGTLRLLEKQVPVVVLDEASTQQVELLGPLAPLRIGLLNLMPAASRAKTVQQFLLLVGSGSSQAVTPVLMRLDKFLPRAGRDMMRRYYQPFSSVKASGGLDGLIMSGANLELSDDKESLLPFQKVSYYQEVCRLIDWARQHVFSTIFSCHSAHLALHHLYKIERAPLGRTTMNNSIKNATPAKVFGVFLQNVDHTFLPALTRGMNDQVFIPMSRWGDIGVEDVKASSAGLKVVINDPKSGWHMVVAGIDPTSKDKQFRPREIYLQGHPEYYTKDLREEYLRDKKDNLRTGTPLNYFSSGDESKPISCRWRSDATVFYNNWVNLLDSGRVWSKKAAGSVLIQGKL